MSVFPVNILNASSVTAEGNMSFKIGDTLGVPGNRKMFLEGLDISYENTVCMQCDHGNTITMVNRSTHVNNLEATRQEDMLVSEVLVTQEKGLALMLLTADCLPVSFYDPVTHIIALAHFSRQTIAQKLPEETIAYLSNIHGINPVNIQISTGPHISTDSYSFPLPLQHTAPAIAPHITKTDTHAHIDLVAALKAQLIPLGISENSIVISKVDTAISPDYFSYYQSKKENTPDGRFATVLMMR
ncbi:MAG: copper oxidase (laccase) domain-containing protein [Patiriisocius sp.]|jgi:copper oxidase (laccase) domain-containing protein